MPYVEQGAFESGFDPRGLFDNASGDVNIELLLSLGIVPFMRCPSSSVPPVVAQGTWIDGAASAMYTGISGATDHWTARDKAAPYGVRGRLSFGGVILSPFDGSGTQGIRLAQVSDGASNTIIVGEQSDWCTNARGEVVECRSDCFHSFVTGPTPDGTERAFNLTTVIHGINRKSTALVGVGANCGPNSPIQSAHPGGAQVLYVDGSVHFLQESLELEALYALANRDDGKVIR